MRYKRKDVYIDAVQWKESNFPEIEKLTGMPVARSSQGTPMVTIDGEDYFVENGEYIVKDCNNEITIYSQLAFEQFFDPVEK